MLINYTAKNREDEMSKTLKFCDDINKWAHNLSFSDLHDVFKFGKFEKKSVTPVLLLKKFLPPITIVEANQRLLEPHPGSPWKHLLNLVSVDDSTSRKKKTNRGEISR
jgi:hypothetical protein